MTTPATSYEDKTIEHAERTQLYALSDILFAARDAHPETKTVLYWEDAQALAKVLFEAGYRLTETVEFGIRARHIKDGAIQPRYSAQDALTTRSTLGANYSTAVMRRSTPWTAL